MLTSLLSGKAAAAVAIAALGIGGVATAAYAGDLPSSVQQFAHDSIGAPAAHRSDHDGRAADHAGTPVGPNAAGRARYGLCTAYAHAGRRGEAAQKSVAFGNLVKEAGGADMVAGYCADVPHPGASRSRSSHPAGKPSQRPHPAGKPASRRAHPAGRPASRPHHSAGKPTAVPGL